MTAQPLEQPAQHVPRPAKTLDGIMETLFGNANADVVAAFMDALDKALASAREANPTQRIKPMHDLVEAWWPEAMFWSDPVSARRILADVAEIQRNGLPPERRGRTREQVIASWEQRHGQKLNV